MRAIIRQSRTGRRVDWCAPAVHQIAGLILLAGLLLRGAVAPGYMLDQSPDSHTLTVTVCGGASPQMMAMMMGGGAADAIGKSSGNHHHNTPATDHFCPFAAAAASAPLPNLIAVVVSLRQAPEVSQPPAPVLTAHAEPVDGQMSARGPPARA
ncbi:MAG: hypothetical protein GC155_05910 [Alphaproteobacteria bacterium]|nr:hypothetical protein [Alphaproteobacteria bacterium]